jgi:hypothetical protein
MRLRKTSAVAAVLGAGATAVVGALITASPASALVPTSITARSIISPYHGVQGNKVSATLRAGHLGVAGKTITFTTGNGVGQCTGVTNIAGVATCFARAGGSLVIVNGGYTATFAGDGVYAGSSDRGNLVGK